MTIKEIGEIRKLVAQARYRIYMAIVLGDRDAFHLRGMELKIWDLQKDLLKFLKHKQPKRLIWSEF
jgi:hypothetical protein